MLSGIVVLLLLTLAIGREAPQLQLTTIAEADAEADAEAAMPDRIAALDSFPKVTLGPLLAESTRFTAGFCEPRSLRFHAGVDYSTGGKVGMPVLAPAGGWVYRIATAYSGYGRQLMLMDSLDRRHLFGHLSAFRADLEEELSRAQQVSGKYFQELLPEPGRYPVRKGEVIAWSGESGNGPPHLHYELRHGTLDRCYNPLRHGLDLYDQQPPDLERLALMPLDLGSRVQGSLMPLLVTPRRVAKDWFILPDTLVCEGALGIAVLTVDRQNGHASRLSPWQLELVEEGDTLFRLRFDSFDLENNRRSGRAFNRWLQNETDKPFIQLWGGDGDLGLWHKSPVTRMTKEGDLMITAWPTESALLPDLGRLEPIVDKPLRQLQVLATDANGNRSRLDLTVDLRLPGTAEVKASRKPDPSPKSPTKNKAAAPTWTLYSLPAGLHLRLSPLAERASGTPPRLFQGKEPVEASAHFVGNAWEWALSREFCPNGPVQVEGVSNAPALDLSGPWLQPDKELEWPLEIGLPCIIQARAGTVAEPAHLLLRRSPTLPRAFEVGPRSLQLERDLIAEFDLGRVPETLRERISLFQVSSKGVPFALVSATRDRDLLRARIGRPGRYGLHADSLAPTIRLLTPTAGKGTRSKSGGKQRRDQRPAGLVSRPTLEWLITYDPSSIANVELLEQGNRHYPHYEPDTRKVVFRPAQGWEPGPVEVVLRVWDGSGNEAMLKSTLTIGAR